MKKSFLTGLIILAPIFITAWLVHLLIHACTAPFTTAVQNFLSEFSSIDTGFWIFSPDQILHGLSVFTILVGIVVVLFSIGFIGRFLYLHILVEGLEQVIDKIPFINKIYMACREFTDVLFSPHSTSFSRVVWAPFPTKKQAVIGLVTNDITITKPDGQQEPYTLVVILGTPNPLQGFVLLCPKESLLHTDLSAEQSIKWVISCGSSEPVGLQESTNDLAKKITS